MTQILEQLHVLAQDDLDGLIELLIFAAVAIFSVLARMGARKKQAGARQEGQAGGQRRPQETWQQRLARKAEEVQRAYEAKEREAVERMRQRGERAAPRGPGEPTRVERIPPSGQAQPGRITVRPTPSGESVLIYERAEPSVETARQEQAARQREAREAVTAARQAGRVVPPVRISTDVGRPAGEPMPGSMAGVTFEPPRPLDPGTEELTVPRGPVGYAPGTIIDDADPDALKKAILHYEILGKPLALRDFDD